MFPARQKSGLIKKKFQLLQQLEQPCTDEVELLNVALEAKPRKIVIKRPAKGPYLAEIKPHYSISGKAIRYDCFVFPRAM
jgi:16S rRNA (guanine1516-N2)-methyltransferase